MKSKFPFFVLSSALLFSLAAPVYAADASNAQSTSQQTLTYEQAIQKALSSSYSLQNAQADIDRAEEVKEKAADNVLYTPAGPGNSYANKAYTGYAKAEIGYSMQKKKLTVEEDSIAYSVREAYNAVLQALEKKKLADQSVENAYLQNNIARYKQMQGLISDYEADKADKTYQSELKNQKAAVTAVDNAYEKLNQLIKVPANTRLNLTDYPTFKKLENVDLEAHVAQVLDENPSIWLAGKNIDLARLDLDLYTFNDKTNPDSYKAKQIDVDKAQYTYSDARDKTAQGVRNIYYNIRQLEENYDVLQQKLKMAEDALRLAQVQFDVGVITKAELSSARLAVEQLKQQLADTTISHDNLIQAFEKPWAVTSAG
jgi:outer membrane protein